MAEYAPEKRNAHPRAQFLMNEEFYFSPVDHHGPFGNDDGADAFAGYATWRESNKNGNPVHFFMEMFQNWGYPEFDFYEQDFSKLIPYLKSSPSASRYMWGADSAIIAIAFGQLYFDGLIHAELLNLATIAINRQLNPQYLEKWESKIRTEREIKLQHMLRSIKAIQHA